MTLTPCDVHHTPAAISHAKFAALKNKAMGFLNSILGVGTNSSQIKEMLNKGAIILDVRTTGEFFGGHVAGSKNIPLQSIGNKVNDIKKWNKPVVLCCASGNRSGQATRLLKKQGIECENGGSWLTINSMV